MLNPIVPGLFVFATLVLLFVAGVALLDEKGRDHRRAIARRRALEAQNVALARMRAAAQKRTLTSPPPAPAPAPTPKKKKVSYWGPVGVTIRTSRD
jgi:hypothetical protein